MKFMYKCMFVNTELTTLFIAVCPVPINRLLLLLQSFNAYVEQPRREQTQKGCLSIGLVVINYWSNLLLFSNMQV